MTPTRTARVRLGAKRSIGWILAAGALAGVLGCPSRNDPERARKELIERAQAFWDAKVERQQEQTYRYLEPEWRVRVTEDEWLAEAPVVRWGNAKVLDAKVHGSQGLIKVEFDYEITGTVAAGKKGRTEGTERWIRVDGVWYKQEPKGWETPDWDAFPEIPS